MAGWDDLRAGRRGGSLRQGRSGRGWKLGRGFNGSEGEVGGRGGAGVEDGLAGDDGRRAAQEEDFATALGEGFQSVELGLGEDRRGGNDHGAVGVAAHGFKGAGAEFEVSGQGILVDDVEVDLALGEHPLRGDEGGVGVAVVEPHGTGGDVERDRRGRAAHAQDVADAANIFGERGEGRVAHDFRRATAAWRGSRRAWSRGRCGPRGLGTGGGRARGGVEHGLHDVDAADELLVEDVAGLRRISGAGR